MVVRQFHGRIGFQGDFTGKSLEFRVFHLGVGRTFGVVRRFAVRFVLPVLVLPVLPVGGGFLLFFFVGSLLEWLERNATFDLGKFYEDAYRMLSNLRK